MDGLAALDYLAASGEVDADRMAIVGWSTGGAMGATAAGRTDHDLDAVALWAPGRQSGVGDDPASRSGIRAGLRRLS
ncbi:S9 family peptidase [Hoeflea sp. WL0058]|uniref:S9 family peptidase n=1 Tax=Flavimaribacter sediminis TaxID=2865987 RepID=A0AAE3D179_9HYPH|nr:S9 family peptidase [Flavimaribacter sediminis]